MATKYRIYCTEIGDEGWQELWSDTVPTECPNNALHTINANSVQILDVSTEIFRINSFNIGKTSNNNFTRIIKTFYSKNLLPLRLVKGIVYKTGNMDSFDLQIYDITNQNELLLVNNITNENEQITINLGIISNPPTNDCIIEINLKKNGGNNKSQIILDELIFYS